MRVRNDRKSIQGKYEERVVGVPFDTVKTIEFDTFDPGIALKEPGPFVMGQKALKTQVRLKVASFRSIEQVGVGEMGPVSNAIAEIPVRQRIFQDHDLPSGHPQGFAEQRGGLHRVQMMQHVADHDHIKPIVFKRKMTAIESLQFRRSGAWKRWFVAQSHIDSSQLDPIFQIERELLEPSSRSTTDIENTRYALHPLGHAFGFDEIIDPRPQRFLCTSKSSLTPLKPQIFDPLATISQWLRPHLFPPHIVRSGIHVALEDRPPMVECQAGRVSAHNFSEPPFCTGQYRLSRRRHQNVPPDAPAHP